MVKGIRERHSRSCRSTKGGRCDCEPSYEAQLWNPAEGKPTRRTFRDQGEAKSWLRDARIAFRRGQGAPGRPTGTLREIHDEWQRLAAAGVIRRQGGDEFKPSTRRAYDQHMRVRVLPDHGDEPLADLRRADWQALVDDLLADGVAPSTIGGTIAAVAAIYRHEVSRGRLALNPTSGLELPTPNGQRERFASPGEAAQLLAAVPADDRPIWATAMYAGLRCGELQALRVQSIRLDDGVIDVHHGWDRREGRIATKGRNRRTVPIPSALREPLAADLLRTGRRGGDLAFGTTATSPFAPQTLQTHADAAWQAARLERVTPHDCRHTYASLMIAAGVNAKALSTYMGHASIQITFDRYGHLMPGNEREAAGLLDTYLAAAARTAAR